MKYVKLNEDQYDLARKARLLKRLTVQLLPSGGTQQWSKENGWNLPADGFEDAFIQRTVSSEADWGFACKASSASFLIRQ